MKKILKLIGIALGIGVIAAPLTVALTIALIPLWSGIESLLGIEALGHSGPADWCYVVTLLLVYAAVALVWRFFWGGHNRRGESAR